MWPHFSPSYIQLSLPAVGRGQWSYSAHDFWRSLSYKSFQILNICCPKLSQQCYLLRCIIIPPLTYPAPHFIQTGRDVIMLALFFNCRLLQKLLLKLSYAPRLLKISQIFSTIWSLITLMNREILSCFFCQVQVLLLKPSQLPHHFICDCLAWWFHELCWGKRKSSQGTFSGYLAAFNFKRCIVAIGVYYFIQFILTFCCLHGELLRRRWFSLCLVYLYPHLVCC